MKNNKERELLEKRVEYSNLIGKFQNAINKYESILYNADYNFILNNNREITIKLPKECFFDIVGIKNQKLLEILCKEFPRIDFNLIMNYLISENKEIDLKRFRNRSNAISNLTALKFYDILGVVTLDEDLCILIRSINPVRTSEEEFYSIATLKPTENKEEFYIYDIRNEDLDNFLNGKDLFSVKAISRLKNGARNIEYIAYPMRQYMMEVLNNLSVHYGFNLDPNSKNLTLQYKNNNFNGEEK